MRRTTSKSRGEIEGYRSGLEEAVAAQIKGEGLPVVYEQFKLRYSKPARTTTYTPDFILPNGIVIETKGRFVTSDRQKHKLIQEQFPDLDVRFVFWNPNSTISKQSETTYAMWCEKLGFLYAKRWIPADWLRAAPVPRAVVAATRALGWAPSK